MSRALSLCILFAVSGAASCAEPGAGVTVYELESQREPTGALTVTADVVGFSRSGGELGRVCVSAHFLPAFFQSLFLKATPSYGAAFEEQRICSDAMEDGSVWSVRFVSARKDLPPGTLVRIQAFAGGALTTGDGRAP